MIEFTIEAKELARAAAAIGRLNWSTGGKGYASAFMTLSTEDADEVQLLAYGEPTVLSIKLAAKVTSAGEMVVLPRTSFLRAIEGVTNDTSITAGENGCTIDDGELYVELRTAPPDTFPRFELGGKTAFQFPASTLRSAFRIAEPCCRGGTGSLGGLAFELSFNGLRLLATDSYELAVYQLSDEPRGEGIWVVPSEAVHTLLASVDDEIVDFVPGTASAAFRCNGVEIATALVNGTYPNINALTSFETKTSATFSAKEMRAALERLLKISGGDQHVEITSVDGGLLVSTTDLDATASAKRFLEAELEGDDIRFGVNPTYFRNVLVLQSTATIGIAEPHKPIRVTGDDPLCTGYIMPIVVSKGRPTAAAKRKR